jgi:uncharacterized membrane protein (UPF0127 family)
MKQNKAFLRLPITAILCLLVGFCISGVPTIHSQGLMKIPIYIKDREIRVEVARTDEERARGLMGRASLGKDEGMIFIFEKEAIHGFWMKNTLLPLSIAFVDKEGRIIWMTDMEPLTLSTHDPPRPVLYALEMNKGWFARNGIKVGDTVRFSK